jgi:hypothetical protein
VRTVKNIITLHGEATMAGANNNDKARPPTNTTIDRGLSGDFES